MKISLGTALAIAAVPTFILIAIGIAQTEPKLVDPEPQRWRTYTIDSDMHIYEWRDDWGRVCTWTTRAGGREQALDCDWPQLNTPRDVE
jgi:hypothetical protein